ncbi:Non-specific serine/threonine protein kinase [Sulfidibacter corallicola]|uniref:Serine/threonine protein kinase n=1 Tax=Sulfidibacter corallicola TaxID=2818388 RepID=A0A8A4TFW9_SULCO|nr:serine/threonine-protein kinase [Sulfidibacter corallicola]QTD48969.1 serine/threonine protein kinase [Sulfidibacter corallicola]
MQEPTLSRQKRVLEILEEVLVLEPDRRETYLRRVCAKDPALHEQVRQCLSRTESSFPEKPFEGGLADGDFPGESPDRIGPFRIVRKLGQGGMGTVYQAEQEHPVRRTVAIKVLGAWMQHGEFRRRFLAESQMLAGLNHPNIAKLFDAGTTDQGLPYFVLEYVEGEPLDRYCDRQGFGIHQRLNLFRKICDAVHEAHTHMIVHRDLKPGNILVTAKGEPKLLDFGIAKMLNPSDQPDAMAETASHVRLMTPRYASPEQIRGAPVSLRSDLYALGVVLYELLTGTWPYAPVNESLRELEKAVLNQEPVRPSQALSLTRQKAPKDPAIEGPAFGEDSRRIRRILSGDLDLIVLKNLSKNPSFRYESAAAFAKDIEAHLQGFPIQARKPSLVYTTGRFFRRNKLLAGFLTVLLLLPSTFTVATLLESRKTEAARHRAELEAATAESVVQFLSNTLEMADPVEAKGAEFTVVEMLDRALAALKRGELSEEPEVRSRLLKIMARTYANMGYLEKAAGLMAEVLEQCRSRNDPFATTSALLGVVSTDLVRGEYKLGLERVREATAMARQLPEGRRRTELLAQALNWSGLLLKEEGQLQEARAAYTEALDLRQSLYGPNHAETAESMSNLAAILGDLEEFSRAEELFKQALAASEGSQNVFTRTRPAAMVSLGKMLQRLGRLDEAQTYFEEALSFSEQVFGPDSLYLAPVLNNLGGLFYARGDIERADHYFKRALTIRTRELGEDHPQTIFSLSNYMAILAMRERYDEALGYAHRVLEARLKEWGTDHPLTALAYANVASIYSRTNRNGLALEYNALVLGLRRKVLGELHQGTATTLWKMGTDLAEFGEIELAMDYFRQAHAIRSHNLGPENPRTVATLTQYVRHRNEQGHHQEALDMAWHHLCLLEASLPEGQAMIIEAKAVYASCLVSASRFEEAVPYLETALRDKQTFFGSARAWVVDQLRTCYVQLGREPEEGLEPFH